MRHSIFWVGDRPHCVWGEDFQEKNLQFIRGIDPEYYDYLARTHYRNLHRKRHRARAAMALRAHYHHSLETLFSLLGATLQAPHCLPAWLQLCRTSVLRNIVADIEKGALERTLLRLERVSWNSITELFHRRSGWSGSRADTATQFARLWALFSSDFLNQDQINEYNSIKHGLRLRSGGFALQVGTEHEYAVPPPDEEMRTLVNSEFGSSYFHVEPVDPSRKKIDNIHIKLAEHAQNWDPAGIALAIKLVAMSINNIRSFLLVLHGESGSKVKFVRPSDDESFELPWRLRPSVTDLRFGTVVDAKAIPRHSPEELKQILHNARCQLRT